MLIGVDEEGGTVNRVSRYSAFRETPFLSPQELYASGGWELIQTDTAEKSQLLLGLGINVNFAPVLSLIHIFFRTILYISNRPFLFPHYF